MAPMTELKVKTTIDAIATVHPGDKLVVALRPMSREEYAKAYDYISKQLPGVDVVIIEANALAVYRDGD